MPNRLLSLMSSSLPLRTDGRVGRRADSDVRPSTDSDGPVVPQGVSQPKPRTAESQRLDVAHRLALRRVRVENVERACSTVRPTWPRPNRGRQYQPRCRSSRTPPSQLPSSPSTATTTFNRRPPTTAPVLVIALLRLEDSSSAPRRAGHRRPGQRAGTVTDPTPAAGSARAARAVQRRGLLAGSAPRAGQTPRPTGTIAGHVTAVAARRRLMP